ncbi:MAG: LamG domain-containing protein [Armatimonadota bacterium]|nr:LamG domain-containing protein [Armatimonadota bacterium]
MWWRPILVVVILLLEGVAMASIDDGLVGHWPLAGDCRDHSGHGNDAVNHGVNLRAEGPRGEQDGAALFDGRSSWLEVPDDPSLRVGSGDFTIAAWLRTDELLDDVIGDICSSYDPASRRGFNLTVVNHAGMTSSQSNYRTLQFGIDDGRMTGWQDSGRPGEAVFIASMAVHGGDLYVGTCEPDEGQAGRVYRYLGEDEWEDCGSPDGSNSVMAMAVHEGDLYVGSAAYNTRGSLLPAAENTAPGGHVYRLAEDGSWTDCGQIPQARATYCLTVYRGDLYGIAMYVPGVYRHDGGTDWAYCGTPGDQRSMALAVHNGSLWASGNGGAGVHGYLGGEDWEFCGRQEDNTQTYSFAIHEGDMYVGTWPDGSVHRYEGGTRWTNVGRLGREKEVMAMAVYNGRMYAGTLPLGQVHRFDGPHTWTLTGQLDTTPDVPYRRVWTMAIHDGWLYAGTLPSGRVYRMQAGTVTTYDRPLPPGWCHIAAVREGEALKLFVNGALVGRSAARHPADYDIDSGTPLRIGFGQHDYLNGSLTDVRVYRRALTAGEVAALAEQ